MGLFDFLDLNGETGAWDMAGTAAKQGMEGYNAGYEREKKNTMDMVSMQNEQRKLDMADLEFQSKQRMAPYTDLKLIQDINVLENGDEEAPPMGSPEYLDYAMKNAVSNSAIDRIKSKEGLELTLQKEEAKNKKFYDALNAKIGMQEKAIGATSREKSRDRAARDAENEAKRAKSERDKAYKRGIAISDKWQSTRKMYAPTLYKNGTVADKDGVIALRQVYNAIKATGSTEAINDFEKKNADDLQFIMTMPPPAPKGKPNSATSFLDKKEAEARVEGHRDTFKSKEKLERYTLDELEKQFKIHGGFIPRKDAEELDRLRAKYKSKAAANLPPDIPIGTVIKGFRYKGGGPGNRNNWEKE